MEARVRLQQIAVRNACTVDWDGMQGDASKRFCGSCKNHVYNLSAMSEHDVEALLARADEICVRYAYRPDGTIVSSSCTPQRRSSNVAAAGVAGALVYSTAFVGISAVIDAAPPADVVTRSDESGIQVAMGMRVSIRIDPATRERARIRKERGLARDHATALAVVEIPAEESTTPPVVSPPQTAVATSYTWYGIALGLGIAAFVFASWLSIAIATTGVTTAMLAARRR